MDLGSKTLEGIFKTGLNEGCERMVWVTGKPHKCMPRASRCFMRLIIALGPRSGRENSSRSPESCCLYSS